MTQAAAIAPQADVTTAQTELGGTVEERSDAIFGPAVFDDGSDDEGQDAEGSQPAEVVPPPAPDALAQERAQRRAQALAELNEKTRNAVDSKVAYRENAELRAQLAQERERSQAYANHVDPRTLTKEQFFALAKQNPQISPQELGTWLREQAADPTLAAARAAESAVDPKLAKLQSALDAANAKIDGFLDQHQKTQASAAEEAAHAQVASFTTDNAKIAPYAASFLQAYGPEEYRKVVEHVLPNVVGGGAQAVLDEVEDLLSARHKSLGAWTPTAQAAPQRTQANQPRISGPATQAPTHVSNSLAQPRSSVVDDESALEGMPYEERASFIFRRH